MNRIILLIIGMAFILSSCGIHSGRTANINNHTTEVVLSQNNYNVIQTVQGSSEATYVFGIGGLHKEAMIAEAKAKMLEQADIVGGAKAIINETVEIKHSFFPFFRRYKVTVSGHVIEFFE